MRQHRDRPEAIGDRPAERAVVGGVTRLVDPLMVVGGRGKGIDPILGDLHPGTDPDFLTDTIAEVDHCGLLGYLPARSRIGPATSAYSACLPVAFLE